MRRVSLVCLVCLSVLALGLVGSGGAARSRVPSGYALLDVFRSDINYVDVDTPYAADGGGLVRSDQVGLDEFGRRTPLSCRLDSVDLTGKTSFQEEPHGSCFVWFPVKQVTTVRVLPDSRSVAVGLAVSGGRVVEPKCRVVFNSVCAAHPSTLGVIPKGPRRTSFPRSGSSG